MIRIMYYVCILIFVVEESTKPVSNTDTASVSPINYSIVLGGMLVAGRTELSLWRSGPSATITRACIVPKRAGGLTLCTKEQLRALVKDHVSCTVSPMRVDRMESHQRRWHQRKGYQGFCGQNLQTVLRSDHRREQQLCNRLLHCPSVLVRLPARTPS